MKNLITLILGLSLAVASSAYAASDTSAANNAANDCQQNTDGQYVDSKGKPCTPSVAADDQSSGVKAK